MIGKDVTSVVSDTEGHSKTPTIICHDTDWKRSILHFKQAVVSRTCECGNLTFVPDGYSGYDYDFLPKYPEVPTLTWDIVAGFTIQGINDADELDEGLDIALNKILLVKVGAGTIRNGHIEGAIDRFIHDSSLELLILVVEDKAIGLRKSPVCTLIVSSTMLYLP
jgi:hypothetical protein